MYRNVWIGIVATVAVPMLVGCAPPGERPEAIREAAELHGELTVEGCLQQDAVTGRFVLTSTMLPRERTGIPVRDGTELPPVHETAPSTIGTVPPALAGPRYIIEPPADVPLQAHASLQVQVTGTLAPQHDAERPVGTTGTEPHVGPDTPAAEPGIDGYIMANEVRLVADTCL